MTESEIPGLIDQMYSNDFGEDIALNSESDENDTDTLNRKKSKNNRR